MNLLAGSTWIVAFVAALAWNPAAVADRSTLEFLTTGAEEGEHWSTVWFVVIDDTVYIRLGPRATRRIERNTNAPRTKIRFDRDSVLDMRYEKAPEMAERVNAAMAEKYWTDILGAPFRKLGLTSPPLMVRLVPDGAAAR